MQKHSANRMQLQGMRLQRDALRRQDASTLAVLDARRLRAEARCRRFRLRFRRRRRGGGEVPLPGGYRVGDEVFYTGGGKTWPDGDRLVYGGKGEVVGPATGEEVSTCVDVQFPGNTDAIDCYLDHLSRAAPPTTLPTTDDEEEEDDSEDEEDANTDAASDANAGTTAASTSPPPPAIDDDAVFNNAIAATAARRRQVALLLHPSTFNPDAKPDAAMPDIDDNTDAASDANAGTTAASTSPPTPAIADAITDETATVRNITGVKGRKVNDQWEYRVRIGNDAHSVPSLPGEIDGLKYNTMLVIDLLQSFWEKYDARTDDGWVWLALVTGLPIVDEEWESDAAGTTAASTSPPTPAIDDDAAMRHLHCRRHLHCLHATADVRCRVRCVSSGSGRGAPDHRRRREVYVRVVRQAGHLHVPGA